MDKIKSVKISIAVTNVFLVVLIVFSLFLPFMISWYVETMKRSESLAAIVLVTCYPCAPFVGAILIFLRKMLKNVLTKGLINDENTALLKKITVCCIIIAAITAVAGGFYMPFIIVSATFAFVALLTFAFRAAICITLQ